MAALGRPALPVFVQVNTSGEASKYGVEPADCVALARHIAEGCPNLRFAGLMTIGMPGEGASALALSPAGTAAAAVASFSPFALSVMHAPHVSAFTPADYSSRPENFQCLRDCRQAVCSALGLQEDDVELR